MELIELDENNNVITQTFGAGFDGAPGISLGKSQYFAWGSTSLYADSKDVYVEDVIINPNGSRSYLCDGKVLPMKERR
jgi:acyl-homoserine lactone acylase PvdQ